MWEKQVTAVEEETEEEGHATTKLDQEDICCFLSSPFLVQNDFRSRPLGSTGARGVIHLANKIQLSQNKIHDCYNCYVVPKADPNGSRRCLCRWRLVWWSWFSGQSIWWASPICAMSDVFHVEWNSKCQFALACFSHMCCPYISGCQKPWSGAACSQSVRPLHVSWQRHCGRWRHRSDEVPSAKSWYFMMFHDVWSFDAGDGEGSWRS